MSSQTCDALWQAAVEELVEALDVEQPEDAAAAPRSLADWARLYIKYVAALRRLCEAHDLAVHPQKRCAMARTLHACIGRVLEVQAWLVTLNGDMDVVGLEAYLGEVRATPEALELPVPACFRDDRAEELAARDAAIAALRAAGPPAPPADDAEVAADPAEPARPEGEAEAELSEPESEPSEAEEEGGEESAGASPAAAAALGTAGEAPPATPDVHGLSDQLQLPPCCSLTPGAAAVRIQAAARGFLARRWVAQAWQEELQFLGMLPPDTSRSEELAMRLEAIRLDRTARRAARAQEYEEGLVSLKTRLKRQEGYAMRERMQEQLNEWFLKSRDPETGAFPDLPDTANGGSRAILRPGPPALTAEEATALAAAKEKEAKGAKGGGKGGKGKGPAGDAPKMGRAFLEDLHSAIQEYMEIWQDYQEPPEAGAAAAVPELADLPQPGGGSGADAPDAGLMRESLRPAVEEEVRLEVDEDMRRMIASIKEMLKAAKDGKKKGKKGDKKGGKKAGGGDKEKDGKGKAAGGKKDGKDKSVAGGAAGGEGEPKKPKKKRKDLTAGRSVESIFAELASQGLVRPCPPTRVADYLGGPNLSQAAPAAAPEKAKKAGKQGSKKPTAAAAKPAKAGAAAAAAPAAEEPKPYPAASMAQVRQAVVSSCILPLGIHQLGAKAAAPRAVLLYGPPGCGKSLLCNAIAHQAGAALFDLSPAATDGKYAGKQAALMVHMVFKAARALAPSVVLIDEVEKVFVSDKARAKALGGREPFNRIKKQLVAEVSDLEPGDGVLVLGASAHPDWCVKKDERALRGFFQRLVELPLPDYGSRQVLLREFGARQGLAQELVACNLSLAAQLTEGYSAGQLQHIVQDLAARLGARGGCAASGSSEPPRSTAVGAASSPGQQGEQQGSSGERRGREAPGRQRQEGGQPSIEDLLLELLPAVAPVGEGAKALRDWTARAHAPLPPEEAPKDKKDTKKKKK